METENQIGRSWVRHSCGAYRTCVVEDVGIFGGNVRLVVRMEGMTSRQLLPPEDLEDEIRRDTANVASRKRADEGAREAARLEYERKATDDALFDGFLDGRTTLQAARVRTALERATVSHVGRLSRRDLVRFLVDDGYRIETPYGKRRLVHQDRSWYFTDDDLTKIALDFAEHIIARRAANAA